MAEQISLDAIWPRTRGFIKGSSAQLSRRQVVRLDDERTNGNKQQYVWVDNPFELDPTKLERMSLRDCHDFCWKSCAVYSSVELQRPNRYTLFDFIDARWFRGEKTRVCWGSFFGKFVDCCHPDIPNVVSELAQVHQTLCDQVRNRQIVLDPQDAQDHANQLPWAQSVASSPYVLHSNYRLLPLFYTLFIVIDRLRNEELTEYGVEWSHWEKEEAHLVFTHDPRGLEVDIEEICANKDIRREENIVSGCFGSLMEIVIALDERGEQVSASQEC